MPRKCSIIGCKSNYASEKKKSNVKVSVYRFPDGEEGERWRKSVPNRQFRPTKNMGICAAHWPAGFETVNVFGKYRPKNLPSIWPNVPESTIPTPPPPPRTTKRALSSARTDVVDELSEFLVNDCTSFETLKSCLLSGERKLMVPIVSFISDETLVLQSTEFISGIPLFVIKIFADLSFELFHFGVRCYASFLSKNRITTIKSWSILDEAVRFLTAMEFDNRKTVLHQHVLSMIPRTVGTKNYSPEIIVRAFEYFSTSRSLYNELRDDYQLPSVTTYFTLRCFWLG